MLQFISKFFIAGSLFFMLTGCEKNIGGDTVNDVPEVQNEIKSTITTSLGNLNFSAKGNECTVISTSASGFKVHLIVGTTNTNPALSVGLTLTDIKTVGKYDNSKHAIITVSLDAKNANSINVFSSELDVLVNITKITTKVIEGNFSGKIINEEGTLTGYVKNGTFRAAIN